MKRKIRYAATAVAIEIPATASQNLAPTSDLLPARVAGILAASRLKHIVPIG
jgi:hypothetical protein